MVGIVQERMHGTLTCKSSLCYDSLCCVHIGFLGRVAKCMYVVSNLGFINPTMGPIGI